jgi:hypothetical protein
VHAAVTRAVTAAHELRREGFRITYLDSTYVPEDGWLGCLYRADNQDETRLAIERAVLPFDDIVEAVRFDTDQTAGQRKGHADVR